MRYQILIMILMFSLFSSCKSQGREVPSWANFFDKKEYNFFIDLIEKYFKDKNCKIQIDDGVILVEKNDFGFDNLGLVNVAQNCKQENQKQWPIIINEHFESMIKATQFDIEFIKIKGDFEQVRKYLGVRIYSVDYFESVGINNMIIKSISDDLVMTLVFDLPHTIENLKSDDTLKWNKQIDELFELGLMNIKNNNPLEISEQQLGDFKIWFVQSDHFYASNIILDKKGLAKYNGSKGALIGIPHRHAVLIYPIEKLEVIKAINMMIPIIKGMYDEGPGSISSHLYWYNSGNLINLPYELSDKELKFTPPESFLNMLNTLKEK